MFQNLMIYLMYNEGQKNICAILSLAQLIQKVC